MEDRLDKSVWGVCKAGEQRQLMREEWLRRTPSERLYAVQMTRETFFGDEAFSPRLQRFLLILNRLEVRYLVVGGWALGFHGWPRLTLDIDIWVAVDGENARKVRRALLEFHAPGPIPDDFFSSEEKNIYFMGLPPTRIEVISSIDGVIFESCFENREVVVHDGVEVPFIGLEDLKRNKAASGRPKDLADLDDIGG